MVEIIRTPRKQQDYEKIKNGLLREIAEKSAKYIRTGKVEILEEIQDSLKKSEQGIEKKGFDKDELKTTLKKVQQVSEQIKDDVKKNTKEIKELEAKRLKNSKAIKELDKNNDHIYKNFMKKENIIRKQNARRGIVTSKTKDDDFEKRRDAIEKSMDKNIEKKVELVSANEKITAAIKQKSSNIEKINQSKPEISKWETKTIEMEKEKGKKVTFNPKDEVQFADDLDLRLLNKKEIDTSKKPLKSILKNKEGIGIQKKSFVETIKQQQGKGSAGMTRL